MTDRRSGRPARVLARMAERMACGRRTPRRYVLSGLLRCGKCGGKLYASRPETSRRYVCLKGPDYGACGRLTVVADPLEHLLVEAVLQRLDGLELADVLAGRNGDNLAGELSDGLAGDQGPARRVGGDVRQAGDQRPRVTVCPRAGRAAHAGLQRQLGR